MEQLGPFHLFFTLSCAEMRWPTVLADVFKTIGNGRIKIYYPKGDYDGTPEEITVTHVNEHGDQEQFNGVWEMNLSDYKKWYFEQKKISMTDFLKDHFILITRIFDKRVKDFVAEVMKKKDIVNYSYRVEFQMRGLPHIHGVAWLDPEKEEVKECLDENGLFKEDNDGEKFIINLVDDWIKCSLEFGHANQESDIKELNAKIQKCKKDLITLTEGIDKISQHLEALHDQEKVLTKENVEQNLQMKEEKKCLKNDKKTLVKEFDKIEEMIESLLKIKRRKELNQLVKEVQMHHCTSSCKKYSEKCRYDFPRFFSGKTIIAKPLTCDDDHEKDVILEKRKFILNQVKKAYKLLDENDEQYDDDGSDQARDEMWEKFLIEKCELDAKEHAIYPIVGTVKTPTLKMYYDALSISGKGGRSVILKRKIYERNVNNYNPLFHSVWQANTDIQLCLDTHAVVSYISDYMTKSDQGLTKLLLAALNEKKNASKFEQLNHIKRTYFIAKQTCVSEAAYRLLPGLNLKSSNIKTLFLLSGFPETRRTYLRQIPEDESQDEGIEVEGRQGRFQQPTSKIEVYEMRPNDSESLYSNGSLENICYAEFCMKYDPVSLKSISLKYDFDIFENEQGHVGIGYERKKQNKPLNGLPKYFFFDFGDKRHYMKLRENPYILRIYAGKRKDHIEESYSELLLFTAWRNEEKTFFNNDPYFREKIREMFRKADDIADENEEGVDDNLKNELKNVERKGTEVEENRKKIYPHSDRIQKLRKLLEEEGLRTSNLGDGIDPAAEQQDADDEEHLEEFSEMADEFPQETSSSKRTRKANSSIKEEKIVYKIPILDDVNIMKKNVHCLSYEQRVVFDLYIDFCKKVMCSVRCGGDIETIPPKIIVHGGGGVGKSYLIKLISQWVHLILSSWGDITEYPKLIRLAFTGAAAYLIGRF